MLLPACLLEFQQLTVLEYYTTISQLPRLHRTVCLSVPPSPPSLSEIISLASKAHNAFSRGKRKRDGESGGECLSHWVPCRELAVCIKNTGVGRGAGPVAETELTAG